MSEIMTTTRIPRFMLKHRWWTYHRGEKGLQGAHHGSFQGKALFLCYLVEHLRDDFGE